MVYHISDFSIIIVAASVSLALVQYFRGGFKEFLNDLIDDSKADFENIISNNGGTISKEALEKEYETINNAKCDLLIWQQSALFFIILSSVSICAFVMCPYKFCNNDALYASVLRHGIFLEFTALSFTLIWVFFSIKKEFKIRSKLKNHAEIIKTGASLFKATPTSQRN